MSASDKKKLRKEQANAVLTEKQLKEKKEAKQLKIYTWTFAIVMVIILAVAASVLVVRAIDNSGVLLKRTIAASVGDVELNTVELNYYYNDAINSFYDQWYSEYNTYADTYLQAIGLDVTQPLSEQYYDVDTQQTWADYFIETAINNAKRDFTFYKLAKADGFELSAEEKDALNNSIDYMGTYATLYGYSNVTQYMRAMYGSGADVDSYREYCERKAIADGYIHQHEDSLKYDATAIDEYEKDKAEKYNSYTYHSAYLSYTDFRTGGKEDDQGNKTYTDEENNAGREAMKVAAEKLATCKTLDALKEMLPTIEVNEDSQLAINETKNERHTITTAVVAEWLGDESRKEGDIAAIPNTSTSTDADGNETTVTNGYYVVYFVSKNTNEEPMSNVRHLLVQFEGGEQDETTGETIYTEEEKAAAKAKADEYLKEWQEGKADEDSFIALVKEHSDDTGSTENGGLYENVNPDSQYVPNFLNWAISPDRQKGDVEIVETEYGYHIMYYVGDSELTYRDYMITEDMKSEDQNEWYESQMEPVKATALDTSKIRKDMVLSQG